MAKDQVSTPFHNAMVNSVSETGDKKDIFDHNTCPAFSKPHDKGPDTIPVVFFETVDGRGDFKHPGEDAAVSSTMGGGVSKKS